MSPIALPSPIPPKQLLDIVLLFGYKQLVETEYNWVVSRDGEDEPLVLPKLGPLVSVTIITKMFEHSGMTLGTYMALKAIIDDGSLGSSH